MTNEIDIRSLREKCSWSQEQLADYLGVDRSSVSRMENGQKPSGAVRRLLGHLSSEIDKVPINSRHEFNPDIYPAPHSDEAA